MKQCVNARFECLNMPKYGLIGYPIAHSLSPRLFKAAYGGRFRYDLLENEDFGAAFSLFMKSYDAVNVTAPFKEQAFDKAKYRSAEAELIGAANILVKTPRGLSCFNSDCTAVKALLDGEGDRDAVRKVLVVGCGGAGKAAAVAAFSLGMDVVVMNRSIQKALSFVQHLVAVSSQRNALPRAQRFGTVSALPLDRFSPELKECDALIYTAPAPLGQFPFIHDDSRQVADFRLKTIIEANYREPAFTPEVISRLPRQVKYVPGEQWLLQQAITGYSLMTGINPDAEALSHEKLSLEKFS